MAKKKPAKAKKTSEGKHAVDPTAEETLRVDDTRWSGFRDGFGERENGVDEQGFSIELVRLPKPFDALELPLSDRILHLVEFDRLTVARALRIDPEEGSARLVVVSERAHGCRLSELLERGSERSVVADLGAGLFITLRLLRTAASLQAASSIAHFAIAPERIVVTPRGEVVMAEAALAAAVEALAPLTPALKKSLRLAYASTDVEAAGPRLDIARIALVGLAMMLGRPLDPLEDVDPFSPAIQELGDVAALRSGSRFSRALVGWIEHAITIDSELSFAEFADAARALEGVQQWAETPCSASRAPLRKYLEDLELDETTQSEHAGLEADRIREIRARRIRRTIAAAIPDLPMVENVAADILDQPVEIPDPAEAIFDRPVEVRELSAEILEQPLAIEEAPRIAEAVGEAAVEDSWALEETTATEEAPALEETPAFESTPAFDQAPVVDETPFIHETPVVDETPLIDETAAVYEMPAPGSIEEISVVEEMASGFDEPVTFDAPVVEAPVVEEVEPVVLPEERVLLEPLFVEQPFQEVAPPVDTSEHPLIDEFTADEPAVAQEPPPLAWQPIPWDERPSVVPVLPVVEDSPEEPVVFEQEPIIAPHEPLVVDPSTPLGAGEPLIVVNEEPEPLVLDEPLIIVNEEPEPLVLDEPLIVVNEEPEPLVLDEPLIVVNEEPEPLVEPEAPEPVVDVREWPALPAAPEPEPVGDVRGWLALPAAPEPEPEPVPEPPPIEPVPEWIRAAVAQIAEARSDRPPAPPPTRPASEPLVHVPEFDIPEAPIPGEIDEVEQEVEPPHTSMADLAREMGLTLDRPLALEPLPSAPQSPVKTRSEPELPPPPQPRRPQPPPAHEHSRPAPVPIAPVPIRPEIAYEPPVPAPIPQAPPAAPRRVRATARGGGAAAIGRFLKIAATLLVGLGLTGALVIGGMRYYALSTAPGTVVIESTPGGAEILVDGAAQGVTPKTLQLSPGSHTLELRRRGLAREFTLNVEPGGKLKQTLDWSTVRAVGTLAVTSNPAGAKVIVDGRERGVTPITIADLPAGTRRVVLESSAGTVRRDVRIEAGRTATLDEAIFSGFLAVFAPVQLQIYERKRLIGTSENERIMIQPGRHELELVNEEIGFRQTRVVDVKPGLTVAVNITDVTAKPPEETPPKPPEETPSAPVEEPKPPQ